MCSRPEQLVEAMSLSRRVAGKAQSNKTVACLSVDQWRGASVGVHRQSMLVSVSQPEVVCSIPTSGGHYSSPGSGTISRRGGKPLLRSYVVACLGV